MFALHKTARGLWTRSARAGRRARRRAVTLEYLEDRVVLTGNGGPPVDVLSYHYDPLQNGANTQENILTPQDVASSDFGKVASVAVDGQIYAQPLFVQNLKLAPGDRADVAFVATETDKVYAINADNGSILWMRDYADPAAGIIPIRSADLGISTISPSVGITGTPVIDPSTNTMYFVTSLEQPIGSAGPDAGGYAAGIYTMQLHAVDITTGQDVLPPAMIGQTTIDTSGKQTYSTPLVVAGTGSASEYGEVPFTSSTMLQRPGLVLDTNVPGHKAPIVFAAFGSSHDAEPYHGWLVGWDTQTLQLYSLYNTTPNGYGGSLWQAGVAPVVLPNGNIVMTTGNGAFDAATSGPPGPSALGFADFGLGYAGIDHSAAVTFSTVIPNPVADATGLFYNGVVPTDQPLPQNGTYVDMSGSGVAFSSAHTMQATLSYDGSTLTETILDTTTNATFTHTYQNVDLPAQVGGGSAYVGFSASTDARLSTNEVTGWTYSSGGSTLVNGFADTSEFTANGTAQFTGQAAQLTGPTIDAAGSVFFNNLVPVGSFQTTFTFQMIPHGTNIIGDGISFIIQKSQGQQQPGVDYGDTMLQLSPTPGTSTVADFFTSAGQQGLEIKDLDFGTAGTIVIPSQNGANKPQTAVELAKTGELFVVNVDNMGHFGQPIQQFSINAPGAPLQLGAWSAMAFYNNTLYIHGAFNVIKAYQFDPTTQTFNPNPISVGNTVVIYPSDSLTVSAKNGKNGIVWDLETDKSGRGGPAILRAYDASNLGNLLYSSANLPSDAAGPAVKFTVPIVVDGMVFVGGNGVLTIYGLKSLWGSGDGSSQPAAAVVVQLPPAVASASGSTAVPVPAAGLAATSGSGGAPGLLGITTELPPGLASAGGSTIGSAAGADQVSTSIGILPTAPNQAILDEPSQSPFARRRWSGLGLA